MYTPVIQLYTICVKDLMLNEVKTMVKKPFFLQVINAESNVFSSSKLALSSKTAGDSDLF